jgi:proteasome lid subunit RPN8/RPN11
MVGRLVQQQVVLPAAVHDRLTAEVLRRYPAKSFGYLVSDGEPARPTGFIMFEENLRNDERWRREFESRGRYFVEHGDAGFVAAPEESLRIHRQLARQGVQEVAVFHTHRRHPGNFSDIDYDLHISRFGSLWHLIISLRNVHLPQLRAFAVSASGVRELEVLVDGAERGVSAA